MDKDTVSLNFDDIRPLTNDEVKDAIEEMVHNEDLERAFRYIKPDLDWEEFSKVLRACKTKEQFKSSLSYEVVMTIARQTTFSLTVSEKSRLPEDHRPCTFISNHRDIILDASFLNVILLDAGYGMTQVAIGDNLLIRSWIKTLVRLNNSFIVKRSISVRQKLEESKKLSSYIHYTIKKTKESVWIAQREGRAKDSNDKTQNSILKMLNMGGNKDILSNIMELN
ncbi:MAG: 1-acyl-sn-glycerol-3-phosphate acyltransferase, partial [Tannerellaceae bacterium]|nr:1-acyl-sn-glycerol-3-phosphate acyltransferase [Tannerellaceae bacterium]